MNVNISSHVSGCSLFHSFCSTNYLFSMGKKFSSGLNFLLLWLFCTYFLTCQSFFFLLGHLLCGNWKIRISYLTFFLSFSAIFWEILLASSFNLPILFSSVIILLFSQVIEICISKITFCLYDSPLIPYFECWNI